MTKVFVYGTLQKGYWNHVYLNGADFVASAHTGPGYTKIVQGLPYLLKDDEGVGCKGEIYNVPDNVLKRLDFLEGHPIWYERTPITVYVDNEPVEVECYLMERNRI